MYGTINIPYGKGTLPLTLATSRWAGVLQAPAGEAIDVAKAVRHVLWYPSDNTLPLAERLSPGAKIAIVISDITRSWIPTGVILTEILAVLQKSGIKEEGVTVIIAIGSHRRPTLEEVEILVPPRLAQRLKIVIHDCHNPKELVNVGTTSRGTPVLLNRHYVEADCAILTGGITYHFMAGFSGGRKSILPGIAGYRTIQANHCMLLEDGNDYGSGKTQHNPLHLDMMEAAGLRKPDFLVNAIPGPAGSIGAVVAGDWDTAWHLGTELVTKRYGVPIFETQKVVVASSGGYPLDINLYQAVKGLINGRNAVSPEGGLVLVAECADGTGADEFSQWLLYPGLGEMEEALRQGFTVPGFIAYTMRRIAQQLPTALVSNLPRKLAMQTQMTPHHSVQEALEWLDSCLGEGQVLVLPQGNLTLPILQDG